MIRVARKGEQTPVIEVPPARRRQRGRARERPAFARSRLALLAALAIGALVRGWHMWGADFPLNDGGLFYVMVRDIQHAHYHLPAFTSYNGAHIPFGYSPLAFYLAAALNDAGVISSRSFACCPSSRARHASPPSTCSRAKCSIRVRRSPASLIAFAIIPRGFVWLLMGGGLTRSFGYLFALLALHQIWLLYTRRSLRYVPLAAVFSALTVLSHLGTAPFVAFSAMLLSALSRTPSRRHSRLASHRRGSARAHGTMVGDGDLDAWHRAIPRRACDRRIDLLRRRREPRARTLGNSLRGSFWATPAKDAFP